VWLQGENRHRPRYSRKSLKQWGKADKSTLTSSIALTECAVSVFSDELHWSRAKGTTVTGIIMILLGTLSCLGYGVLSFITPLGMPFLDFFDFLTNSIMMPVSALMICILVSRYMGIETVVSEVRTNGHPFRREAIFRFMIRYVCPLFILIILISSVASAFGIITL
jgi:NSS family neurotransmitter:Na+ symporter